jgi:hypothetical protein
VFTISLAPCEEHSAKESMNEYNIQFWQISMAHAGMKQMQVC